MKTPLPCSNPFCTEAREVLIVLDNGKDCNILGFSLL